MPLRGAHFRPAPNRHPRPSRTHTHDLAAAYDHAEIALLAAQVDIALLAADIDAQVVPPDARRGRFPHEQAAGVNFADLTTAVDQRAATIARRLADDRARFADLLHADLAATIETQAHLPPAEAAGRRLDALLDPTQPAPPIADTETLVARAELAHIDELNAAARDGIDRAIAEAERQGLPAPGVPRLSGDVDARINTAARRLAAAPHADVVKAARDAAYQAPRSLSAADTLAATRQAVDDLAPSGLANYARPATQQAHNLGHQEAAATMPAVAHIYASELLDSNTCGPCSLIDGHEYDSEEEALADYPDGTYTDCEGGDRCRGTLVYVWSDETPPSTQTPGDEPPPDEPPPPYPFGTSRPFDPGPPTPLPPPPTAPPPTAPPPTAPPPTPPIPGVPGGPDPFPTAQPLLPAPDEPPAPALPAGITPEDLDRARASIPAVRAELRALAAQTREEALAALEQVDALKLDRPPQRTNFYRNPTTGRTEYRADHSGEWDWFHGLSTGEQTRLRRTWFYNDVEAHGAAPDEIAAHWANHYANAPTSTDDVMAEWLDVTRRADAASALSRGRLPNPDLYGGLDANTLLASPWDARTVFSNDLDAVALHIAAQTADLEREYAERAFRPAKLGPAPYRMSTESFVSELTTLEEEAAKIAPLAPGDEWAALSRDDQEVLDRLAELVPDGIENAGELPANELHSLIVDLAHRAALA